MVSACRLRDRIRAHTASIPWALPVALTDRGQAGRDGSRGALLAVSVALFCIQLDFFALNLALPDMARTFHVGVSDAQWTISAYMPSLGSLFILAGRTGDIFGRRRALLCGIALFGAASGACAVAPSLGVLVAFRVLQGAGAALIFPVGIAALSNEFDEQSRGWALGLAFGIANVGTALGPFAGGGLAGGHAGGGSSGSWCRCVRWRWSWHTGASALLAAALVMVVRNLLVAAV
jgi:MFS family permease